MMLLFLHIIMLLFLHIIMLPPISSYDYSHYCSTFLCGYAIHHMGHFLMWLRYHSTFSCGYATTPLLLHSYDSLTKKIKKTNILFIPLQSETHHLAPISDQVTSALTMSAAYVYHKNLNHTRKSTHTKKSNHRVQCIGCLAHDKKIDKFSHEPEIKMFFPQQEGWILCGRYVDPPFDDFVPTIYYLLLSLKPTMSQMRCQFSVPWRHQVSGYLPERCPGSRESA
jgi:hypothetical protein